VSWERALRDAERWIQTLPLPKPIKGQFVNLDNFSASLSIDGNYRIIVLRAAKRLLEKRGADVYFTEPAE
jgi:hypothetical protein